MNNNQICVNCPPSYVLLNRQFADVDPMDRNGEAARSRILISISGSDPEGFGLRVIAVLKLCVSAP